MLAKIGKGFDAWQDQVHILMIYRMNFYISNLINITKGVSSRMLRT